MLPLLCTCGQAPTFAGQGAYGWTLACPDFDLGKPHAWGDTKAQAVADWNEQITDRLAARDLTEVYVPAGVSVDATGSAS
jgi:hypothetical protein